MSSLEGAANLHTVGADTAKHYLSQCPTHSLWFEQFSKGCLSRMGQEVRQDMALSVPVIMELLRHLEQDWDSNPEWASSVWLTAACSGVLRSLRWIVRAYDRIWLHQWIPCCLPTLLSRCLVVSKENWVCVTTSLPSLPCQRLGSMSACGLPAS